METDERLQRIETDIHEMKADITDIKVNVAKITATIESTFPHLATKAEVEEAKHEATKGKYGVLIGVTALLLSLGTLVTKFMGE